MQEGTKGANAGWLSGFIGIIIFSGSLPATRLAVGHFTPVFIAATRAVIAALLAAVMLLSLRAARPQRVDVRSLALVAGGVVIGFPLLTAVALQQISAAHSLVFIGLMPLATALFGVLRARERPHAQFWLFSGVGAVTVSGYALWQSDSGSVLPDVEMVTAILLCGLGYAEGAVLARRLGGWQVICWALLLALPVGAPVAFATMPTVQPSAWRAWAALAYLSVFSMLLGFVFWYRGLALGGVTGVSQLQLLQPFVGFLLAAIVLHVAIVPGMLGCALIVVLSVFGARRVS